ncbi:hypothetical protein Acy02nite_68220 [Actinoplanes cyaneus]|uniref:Uncharacterized protein n=1 Tax=Actinoplanes cyaneus TaxID=52696 RepID=A0A919IPR5_9ACTN|nr:hypothetical protein [Actinoplanes cyaneus]GID68941.1 hypothetical protein Acy02nite_68220 [Actinoplanes cyaneus]
MGAEPFGSLSAPGPAGARSGNPLLSPWRVGNVVAAGFDASPGAGRVALPSQLFSAGPVRPGRP